MSLSLSIYVKSQSWRTCCGLICALPKRITESNINTLMISHNKQSWIPTDSLITWFPGMWDKVFCSPHRVCVPWELRDHIITSWFPLFNWSSTHMIPFGFILEGAAPEPESLWPFIYSSDCHSHLVVTMTFSKTDI